VHFHIAWPATIYGCNTGIDRPTHTEQLAYELIRKGILTQGEHKLSYDINMINAEMIHIAREYIQSETDGQIDPRKLFLHYSSPAIVSKLVPGWASSGGLCDYCVSGKWPGGYTREILV